MTKDVRRLLTEDSQRQAEMAAEEIGDYLETTQGTSPYIQGGYTILKRWYFHTSERKPNPYKENMDKVFREYADIYQWEELPPPRRLFHTHVAPFQIEYGLPT